MTAAARITAALVHLEAAESSIAQARRLLVARAPWEELAELVQECSRRNVAPVGWRVVRSLVPDAWGVEHVATGARWLAIVGTDHCGHVPHDEDRLERVLGPDGEEPPPVGVLLQALRSVAGASQGEGGRR